MAPTERREKENPFANAARTMDFWRRASGIYLAYKGAQVKGLVAQQFLRKSEADVKQEIWVPHHEWAGGEMYKLCVDLRGFYLKAGQFIGSRGDFVPEQICKQLTLLCDRVPPMTPELTKKIILRELGVTDLSQVFEWIDLEKPIGSASISQVHKAQLRSFSPQELHAARSAAGWTRSTVKNTIEHVMRGDQDAWNVCNQHGISLAELKHANKGVDVDLLLPGQKLRVPVVPNLEPGLAASSSSSAPSVDSARATSYSTASTSSSSSSSSGRPSAVAAVLHAVATGQAPKDGLVAVKVQYPDALGTMSLDLQNIRAAAFYLSKTELKFDMVSAVDELNKQIRLEFDFTREARVMDTISEHLAPISKRLAIPRSIGGLVSKRLLVMTFLEGTPLQDARSKVAGLSARKRAMAQRLILSRVSEAYGRMILGEGLFQADGHPGNILIGRGGCVGLLDYGQSKQLPDTERVAFARLVLALTAGKSAAVSAALSELGVVTEKDDPALRTEMAYGMFDTRGKVDPFDPNSPIKRCAVSTFPADLFFVLRTVQLLRGLANGMGVNDFSSAKQWEPFAKEAIRRSQGKGRRGLRHAFMSAVTWPYNTMAALQPLLPPLFPSRKE